LTFYRIFYRIYRNRPSGGSIGQERGDE